MTVRDNLGHALTGAGAHSVAHYETALRQFQCLIGDPVASVDATLSASPDFVMAHALKAYLHLLGTEPNGLPVARECYRAASRLPADARERGHLQAIRHLVDGRWWEASRTLEDVAIEHPCDVLALQAGHQIDFFTGHARMLRDRIARALPAWHPGMPSYHAILGMHAFGLEETGDYHNAEAQGRKGVELEPRDGWAQHAVAHVMEMQGRQRDGIAWMRANPDAWSKDSFFCTHNWWHLALYHLDLGEVDEVLSLFDGSIYGSRSAIVLDMIDASAMLWRLFLRGIDAGDRWNAVADNWEPIAAAGNYAFNDVHAMMAFVGAGRTRASEAVLEAQKAAMAREDDNAAFTREVGHPVAKAIRAFGDEDYEETIRLLRPVRTIAHRFGGSHAQRDVLDLTLVEAAFRSGQTALATALAAERIAIKPTSPLARLFVDRANAMAKAA
jgi:tetratricopeptide (TPR) repeat protein